MKVRNNGIDSHLGWWLCLILSWSIAPALPTMAQDVELGAADLPEAPTLEPAQEMVAGDVELAEVETAASPVVEVEATPAHEAASSLPTPPTEPRPSAQSTESDTEESAFSYVVFGDVYAGVSTNLAATGRSPGPSFAFAPENGVGLAFAGGDLRYNTQYFGVSVDARVGSAVPSLLGSDLTLLGSVGLKQAFVSVRPHARLRIDAGQFDTIYGAEVSESWLNANYTRGALYFVAQPFFHTGLRVSAELPGGVELRAIAVQGWNSVVDNNEGKSFGAQFVWGNDVGSLSIGYIGGPEQDAMVEQLRMPGVNGRWRHLVDVVAGVEAGPVSFLFNGDLIHEEVSEGVFSQSYGAMLTVRYGFAPFAVAARAEVLHDGDGLFLGVPDLILGTGTITFEAVPIDGLVLRLDARYDAASAPVFASGSSGFADHAFRVVLGAVIHSGR